MNDQARYGTQPDRLQARYVTPPKKEWVGLTDEEIRKIDCIPDDPVWQDIKDFTRAIEARLKEKNT